MWLLLSLFCAFFLASSDALVKRALQQGHNEYLVAWLRLLWSLPAILVLNLILPAPTPGPEFYRAALVALPLELAALILYVKALRLSPLSLAVPFLSLTPVFLLLVPTLLLGERLTLSGGLGVALIAVGGYSLHLRRIRDGFWAPLKAVRSEPGSLCMIAVALIYSVTSTLGKQAISASSPLYFAAFYFPLLAVLMTPLTLWRARSAFTVPQLRGAMTATFAPGMLFMLMLISHMFAINMVNVAYMISVKRLSLVIGVLYGHWMFGEQGLAERLLGTLLMVTGVALILIAAQ